MTEPTREPVNGGETSVDFLDQAFRAIFSWVFLMPIAVIGSGKLLSQPLKLKGQSRQFFRLHIPYVIHLEARNSEAILGFCLFVITLGAVGGFAGDPAYALMKDNFGLDPGQFNALCIMSSFGELTVSAIVWGVTSLFRGVAPDPATDEHNRLLREMRDRGEGDRDE